jgi:hypothetical protein
LLTDPVAAALSGAMERLSRLRGKRIFHPYGVGFAASLERLDRSGAALPFHRGGAERVDAQVRLSRAFGLPEWLPDPCGLAVRVPDAYGPGRHQDLLLVSAGWAPLLRHVPSPARDFADRPYSTLLPYRLDDELVVLGARLRRPPNRRLKLADLRRRRSGDLSFELHVASPGGEWRPLARLALGERLPEEETERLDFDPTNTGNGLELAGLVNRLRGPSYRGSQRGRT